MASRPFLKRKRPFESYHFAFAPAVLRCACGGKCKPGEDDFDWAECCQEVRAAGASSDAPATTRAPARPMSGTGHNRRPGLHACVTLFSLELLEQGQHVERQHCRHKLQQRLDLSVQQRFESSEHTLDVPAFAVQLRDGGRVDAWQQAAPQGNALVPRFGGHLQLDIDTAPGRRSRHGLPGSR